MLDVAYRVTSEDLARIPATVIRRVRRDFKIVANSLLASVPELQPKDSAVVGPMAWGSVIGQLACGAANLGCKPVFSRLGRAGKRVRRQNCPPHKAGTHAGSNLIKRQWSHRVAAAGLEPRRRLRACAIGVNARRADFFRYNGWL
jgi:hypothetical protein